MSPPLTWRIRATTARSTDRSGGGGLLLDPTARILAAVKTRAHHDCRGLHQRLGDLQVLRQRDVCRALAALGARKHERQRRRRRGIGEVVDQRLQRPARLVVVGNRLGRLPLLPGVEQLLGLQDDHHAPRGDHRQRARGLGDHDGRHRGVGGVQALDIEGAQVLLDHLAQRHGQRRLLVVVVTDDQRRPDRSRRRQPGCETPGESSLRAFAPSRLRDCGW